MSEGRLRWVRPSERKPSGRSDNWISAGARRALEVEGAAEGVEGLPAGEEGEEEGVDGGGGGRGAACGWGGGGGGDRRGGGRRRCRRRRAGRRAGRALRLGRGRPVRAA